MSARAQTLLWIVQRASAALLAIAVTVHLVGIIHAVQGGLSGHEIVSRISAREDWLAFYAVFVVAAAIHAAIGMRAILRETAGLPALLADIAAFALAGAVAWLGLRAVLGLFGASTL
jgi:fumarate reductase subunit C